GHERDVQSAGNQLVRLGNSALPVAVDNVNSVAQVAAGARAVVAQNEVIHSVLVDVASRHRAVVLQVGDPGQRGEDIEQGGGDPVLELLESGPELPLSDSAFIEADTRTTERPARVASHGSQTSE